MHGNGRENNNRTKTMKVASRDTLMTGRRHSPFPFEHPSKWETFDAVFCLTPHAVVAQLALQLLSETVSAVLVERGTLKRKPFVKSGYSIWHNRDAGHARETQPHPKRFRLGTLLITRCPFLLSACARISKPRAGCMVASYYT